MTDITAAAVQALRAETGAPMMDCKRALAETGGDPAAAKGWLREKGIADASKRAGRATDQSRICIHVSEDGAKAGIIELCCETEPVAQLDEFKELARTIAAGAAMDGGEHLAAVFADKIQAAGAKTGENIVFKRHAALDAYGFEQGIVAAYTHGGDLGSRGVLVALDSDCSDHGALREFGRNVAMHIAGKGLCDTVPLGVSRGDIDAAIVEQERAVLAKDPAMAGKPPEIAARIIDGKMNKFFANSALLEQKYVKDSSMTVAEYSEQFRTQHNCSLRIAGFVRFEAGE